MANNILKLSQFIDLYHSLVKVSYIRKLPNGKYRVFSEKGKNLGTYNTKDEAKTRLRQIEFFKHKKASKNTIDLSHLDNITYSAVVRELNKINNKQALIDFLSMYKKCFDALVIDNNKHPSDCALPKTLISFTNMYDVKLPEKTNDKKTDQSK